MININATKNEHTLIAEIKMMDAKSKKVYFLVEGINEQVFLSQYISQDNCVFIDCGGKNNVIKTITLLNSEKKIKAFGLYDRDYDDFSEVTFECNNLFSTDTHDIDTDILDSNAFKKYISTVAGNDNLTKFKKLNAGVDFYTQVKNYSIVFGKLRLINEKRKLKINFCQKFSPWKFFLNGNFDPTNVIREFSNLSQMPIAELENSISSITCSKDWSLIQGHDAFIIIYIMFKKLLKGSKRTLPLFNVIAQGLSLAFHVDDLKNKCFFTKIKKWERRKHITVFNL